MNLILLVLEMIMEDDEEVPSLNKIRELLEEHSNMHPESLEKFANLLHETLNFNRANPELSSSGILFAKTFQFKTIQNWADELYDSAMKFKEEYRIFPNILIANPHTLNKIDIITHHQKDAVLMNSETGLEKTPDEFVHLGAFCASQFEIEFTIRSSLSDLEFILVYDSDPDFDGGEPIPEEKHERILQLIAA